MNQTISPPAVKSKPTRVKMRTRTDPVLTLDLSVERITTAPTTMRTPLTSPIERITRKTAPSPGTRLPGTPPTTAPANAKRMPTTR